MNTCISRAPAALTRLALFLVLLLPVIALGPAITPAGAQEPAPVASGPYTVLLPSVARESDGTTPPPEPARGSLPAELQGTWSAGNLPFVEIYDPATGRWLPDVVGLGQLYEFRADGTYTYAAQLTIGSFPCVSRSATYETGTARAQGAQLVLTASFYRNRTSTCGGPASESTQLPAQQTRTYLIQFDAGGFAQLYLDTGSSAANFVLRGEPTGAPEPLPVPDALVGSWRSGELTPDELFDPETRTWNEAPGEGEWFRFAADGSYTYGAFASRVVDGCTQRVWLYVTGKVEVGPLAAKLTPEYFPGPSLQRAHDSCRGGDPTQVVWQGGDEVVGWSIDSATGALTLTRGPFSGTYTRD